MKCLDTDKMELVDAPEDYDGEVVYSVDEYTEIVDNLKEVKKQFEELTEKYAELEIKTAETKRKFADAILSRETPKQQQSEPVKVSTFKTLWGDDNA